MTYPASYTNLTESATDATPDGLGGYVPATGTLLSADAAINDQDKAINRIEQSALGLSSDGRSVNKVYGRLLKGEVGQVTRDTVASAATLTLPEAGVVAVTGTTTVTAITATGNDGRLVVLEVPSGCQLTDNGTTLNLGGNDFVGPGQLTLECDGTNWKLVARSDAVAGAGAQPLVEVTMSGNQTLTHNTPAILLFDTDVLDADGFHSTSSNTSRLVVPSGVDGRYDFWYYAVFDANATGYRTLKVFKNSGGTIFSGDQVAPTCYAPANGSGVTILHGSGSVDLVAGDYLELHALQTSGGSLDVYAEGFTVASMFILKRSGA